MKDSVSEKDWTDTIDEHDQNEALFNIEVNLKDKDDRTGDIQSHDPVNKDIYEKDDEMEVENDISENEGKKVELKMDETAEVEDVDEGEIKTRSDPPSNQNDKTDPNGNGKEQEDDTKTEIVDSEDDNEENELVTSESTVVPKNCRFIRYS
ncbi:hypothetical protein BLNAU_3106 [Blattamonas nauphoetae]|uniref:Uncharacterized protein n=1 Tax=Blattamonas nauphoetae TaxID=2049346 RepID=A0ABQ9YE50_9EUKA|nr:hypothetical protein BLNAU_3106 [Blattamonas nauphoetae]